MSIQTVVVMIMGAVAIGVMLAWNGAVMGWL